MCLKPDRSYRGSDLQSVVRDPLSCKWLVGKFGVKAGVPCKYNIRGAVLCLFQGILSSVQIQYTRDTAVFVPGDLEFQTLSHSCSCSYITETVKRPTAFGLTSLVPVPADILSSFTQTSGASVGKRRSLHRTHLPHDAKRLSGYN